MEFKYNLRNLRREKGVTVYDSSKSIGVCHQTISKWENGKAIPSGENAQKLAEYFGVTIDYLLGRNNSSIDDLLTPDEVINITNNKKFLKDFSSLKDEQQKEVLDFIAFLRKRNGV